MATIMGRVPFSITIPIRAKQASDDRSSRKDQAGNGDGNQASLGGAGGGGGGGEILQQRKALAAAVRVVPAVLAAALDQRRVMVAAKTINGEKVAGSDQRSCCALPSLSSQRRLIFPGSLKLVEA